MVAANFFTYIVLFLITVDEYVCVRLLLSWVLYFVYKLDSITSLLNMNNSYCQQLLLKPSLCLRWSQLWIGYKCPHYITNKQCTNLYISVQL